MTAPSDSPRARRRHFDSPQQEAFLNLWRTYDRLRAYEDALFSQHGLTPQQYNALRLLRSVAPESLPTLALAGRLVSHAPDITRLLDKLAERNLIVRERPAHNRRIVQVRITEEGLSLLDTLDQPVRDCHQQQFGHMDQAELQTLVALLERAREPHETRGGPWSDCDAVEAE